jgi:ketopantoate reductase
MAGRPVIDEAVGQRAEPMKILIIGAGVIGTVYGAHLGDGTDTHSPANVIAAADHGAFDLVLVALRRDQLDSAATGLATVTDRPLILFLGNNPAGRRAEGEMRALASDVLPRRGSGESTESVRRLLAGAR